MNWQTIKGMVGRRTVPSPKQEVFNLLDRNPEAAGPVLFAIEEGLIQGDDYGDWFGSTFCGCLYAHVGAAQGRTAYEVKAAMGHDIERLTELESFLLPVERGWTPRGSKTLRQLRQWVLEWQGRKQHLPVSARPARPAVRSVAQVSA